MPYNLKDPVRHKFTKKHYNKRDWKAYDQGLQNRGSLTIWFSEDVIASWSAQRPEKMKRGRQRQYSEIAIETALTLRLVYKQPLRQTEGFLKSIARLMDVDIPIPDHTTVSRRSAPLKVHAAKIPTDGEDAVVVIIDSTGIKVIGEKEWMNMKHGTRQRKVWRKLHLIIRSDGEILASTLTTHDFSDVSQVPHLLKEIDEPISECLGDSGGYDHPLTYKSLEEHEKRTGQPIKAVIPPNTGFKKQSDYDSSKRIQNIEFIETHGKQKWQQESNYGRRSLVENIMYRYKTIIGRTFRSRNVNSQNTEVKVGVKVLNKMKGLGMPKAQKAA